MTAELPPPVPGTHFGWTDLFPWDLSTHHRWATIRHVSAVLAFEAYRRGWKVGYGEGYADGRDDGVRETRLAYGRIG